MLGGDLKKKKKSAQYKKTQKHTFWKWLKVTEEWNSEN